MQVSFCNQRCIYSNRYLKGYGRERGATTGRGLHRKLLLMEQLCLRLVPRGVRIGVWARRVGGAGRGGAGGWGCGGGGGARGGRGWGWCRSRGWWGRRRRRC